MVAGDSDSIEPANTRGWTRVYVSITYLLTGLLITATVFTLGGDMLGSFKDVTDSWSSLEARSQQRADTKVTGPTGLSVNATSTVQINLANRGRVALGQFSDWDVIFEIQQAPGLGIAYLKHTSNPIPGANQWTVQEIHLSASSTTPEIVDPGVLNPGEEMVIVANPSPPVAANTHDRATFVTPNGVTAKVIFEVVP